MVHFGHLTCERGCRGTHNHLWVVSGHLLPARNKPSAPSRSSQGPPVSAVIYAAAGRWAQHRSSAPLRLFSEFGAVYKYSDLLTYLPVTGTACMRSPDYQYRHIIRPWITYHDIEKPGSAHNLCCICCQVNKFT